MWKPTFVSRKTVEKDPWLPSGPSAAGGIGLPLLVVGHHHLDYELKETRGHDDRVLISVERPING